MADRSLDPGVVDWAGANLGMHREVKGARREGARGEGKPMRRDSYETKSTTAFLAFSEIWARG